MKKMSFLLVAVVFFAFGCASTKTVNTGKVTSGAIPVVPESTAQTGETSSLPQIQQANIQAFADRVEWPERSANAASFRIESGIADAVWVEGKGYFRGTLEQIFSDLTNEKIIGPTHMTQNIVRDNYIKTPENTSYIMHVQMKYIFNIEFDLSATLKPIYDGDVQTGWLYKSDKTSGTRFIKMISDTIVIKQLEDNWFSVEMQSLNQATKDKEEEARGHIETLFSYWQQASINR